LKLLRAEGYDTGVRDWRAADIERLLQGDADEIEIPISGYLTGLKALPPSLQRTLAETWGEPKGDAFRSPVLRCGNVLVLLQPDRGALADHKSGYHDINCPPSHAYVALYAWLRETARIDALIHLGTHGTLEWLPGKTLALSGDCWPEAVLGALPVVYPFIVNNPGEAVQAKRRLAAVTIGHLTPPLSAAGLHGPLAELEGIIEEYAAADGLDRRRLSFLEDEIVERAWNSGLAADCGLVKGEPNRQAIAKLDAQLCDIKELSIRDGLHIFGRTPDEATVQALALVTGREVAIRACGDRERAALVATLDGRRVAPGPAGAPSRGRADVLPTGRNLTSIDPRAIPTRTASAIGVRAANEVVRRYLQDHGEPPRALVIDLWASASLRTGGDDLAQALWYLGVQPTWDKASSRVTGIEILPLAVLDRPRIDVTLRISGLFRDIFETQIALFDMAVRRIAELDEPADDNPLAEARRRGADLARVFGGAPGSYGAQAAVGVGDGGEIDLAQLVARARRRPGLSQPRVRSRRAGSSAGRPRARPFRWRRRRRLCRRIRRGGGPARQRARTLPSRHKPDRRAQGAPAGRGDRPRRARPAHQSALARRHAGARPSRRGRDRPGRRCALCLCRDHPRGARSSVRCHARRPDRRRGRADGDDGEEPGCHRGDRRTAARRLGARTVDDAAQRGRS
jgi:cobaltochelatase CobN